MASYSVLIADDQPHNIKPLVERLFQNKAKADFTWRIAEGWSEFCKFLTHDFDAVLLDVNLDGWGKTLGEALEQIGGKCPVVLVSQFWEEPRTHENIAEALSKVKKLPFVGTLVLNDLGRDGWENHASSMCSQLILAITRYRQQGLLEVDDNKPIRILHLSDPQYGDPGEDNLAFLVEKEIPRFVIDDLALPIHFIVITGDITYSGHPDEYILAEEKLNDLVRAFLPNREDWRERILLVPGNHDVNLRLAAADRVKYSFSDATLSCINTSTTEKESHRSYALQPFRDFSWRLTGNPQWRDSDELCWINDSFHHLGLRFYLFNSAATINCNRPKTAEIPLQALDRIVSAVPEKRDLLGIVLSHHGPNIPKDTNIEPISNWPQVAKTIQNSPIRLFVHGHGHDRLADFCPLSDRIPRKPEGLLGREEVFRVMAPTTHLNHEKRRDGTHRGFNLITLSRINGRVEEIEVDSYILSGERPHRASGAPWRCRV